MQNLAAIVIPAYNPKENLIKIVEELVEKKLSVIIVNDGSSEECDYIFDKIKNFNNVFIIKHDINKGKGIALKTAFNYFLQNVKFANFIGIICADADGQHLTKDIVLVGETLIENPNSLVIGSRKFSGEVPLRSKFGNILTKYIFRILIGNKVSDTQSGLRGLSRNFMQTCLDVKGSRYEFETEMLIMANKIHIDIKNVEIETVYEKGNKSSHFNPIIDSIKIYYCFIRFIINALSTSVIDYVVFIAIYLMYNHLLTSLIIARIIACVYNFIFSKTIVFKSHVNIIKAIIKYIALVVIFMLITLFNIEFINHYFGINVYIAKAISEFCLFFVSFFIQRTFIFSEK